MKPGFSSKKCTVASSCGVGGTAAPVELVPPSLPNSDRKDKVGRIKSWAATSCTRLAKSRMEGGMVAHTDLQFQCMTYLAAKEVVVKEESTSEVDVPSSEEDSPHGSPQSSLSSFDSGVGPTLAVQEQIPLSVLHQRLAKSWDGIALDISFSSSLFALEEDSSKGSKSPWDPTSRSFDQFAMREEELPALAVDLFAEMGIMKELGIPRSDISKMVKAAQARYNNQPYHNFRHAFDVFQATTVLLHQSGLAHTASKVELLALLSSALLHDGAS